MIEVSEELQPTQLHLAFGEDPRTILRVMWQTQKAMRKPVVQYGTFPTLAQMASAQRVSYPYETGILYEVTLRGLKPGTKYYYRVGDPPNQMSKIYTFRTAPNRLEDFVFTAFGDHGMTAFSQRNTQNILKVRPAFHLLLGDLSYANGHQPIWDTYLQQLEPLASQIPVMITLGNHENETIEGKRVGYLAALTRFAMPGAERYYSFDYCGVRFVCFNSNEFRNPDQLKWLEATLHTARRARSVRWLIMFQHHSLFGSTRGRGNNSPLIEALQPLYDRYRVDLVLQGHDHVYERTYPIRASQPVSQSQSRYQQGEGTLYVICGGGGRSLYRFTPEKPALTAVRESTYCYLRVQVPTEGPLTLEAFRVDNSLIERFQIVPRA